ncbi:MAG: TrkH family potassium uptake protein [Sandaracinaceae bacterium]|nr:TrkH family potassium uptake protein [Sandaracinaceae bacterium]
MLALSLTSLLAGLIGGIWDLVDPLIAREEVRAELALTFTGLGIAALGAPLYLLGAQNTRRLIDRREAILTVVILWLLAGLISAIPLHFGQGLAFEDAIFEAFSGLTTTGASVLPSIERGVPRAIILYRVLLQWLGGVGIVVLFAALFPKIGAAGKRLFRDEAPAQSGRPMRPRIRELSLTIWAIYSALTLLLVVLLLLLGMGPFDALCHAMATLATGGFSTRDAAIASFESPAIELIIAAFMLIGAMNFGLYFEAYQRRSLRPLVRNIEVRTFLGLTLAAWLLISWMNRGIHHEALSGVRHAFFLTSGTISSTGFNSDVSLSWPASSQLLLLILMFFGGCAGSTSGGLKIERVIVLYQVAITQIKKSFRPHAVEAIRIGRRALDPNAVASVMAILILYFFTTALGTLAITSLDPVGVEAAFGVTLGAVTNAGLMPFHEAGLGFADYSAGSKLVLSALMLLGRLEFLAILALFVPRFWWR